MILSEFEKSPERVDELETLGGHYLDLESILPFL
jgi:hypothetical protein